MVRTSSGAEFIADITDLALIEKYTWCISGNGYVMSRSAPGGQFVALHRLLLAAGHGWYVDHINGDPLDNRRRNLRLCRKQQNEFNTKVRADNTSGFRGVCRARRGKYRAYISKDGKQRSLGEYRTPQEAAAAYNRAAADLFGEFARLNVID